MKSLQVSNLSLEKLILNEVISICKIYKVDKNDVIKILQEKFDARSDILEIIKSAKSEKALKKNEVYKTFIKKIRKEIYYSLRRYQSQKEDNLEDLAKSFEDAINNSDNDEISKVKASLVSAHKSTLERLGCLEEFSNKILKITKDDRSIVDIGAGIYPLVFPFEKFKNLKEYIAIEKSEVAVKIINLYAKTLRKVNLEAFCHNIDENFLSQQILDTEKQFDTALMFKLIPLIARQDRMALDQLANFPAEKMIITGCKKALAKNIDITRREDRVIREFIKITGKEIIERFEIGDEFGYVIS